MLNVVYADSITASVAKKPIMLSVVILTVIMLSVVILTVIMLSVVAHPKDINYGRKYQGYL